MTLTELRYIVALARERHFGNAAQTCFVSQPTLSIAIKKIEEELGVKIFERGSNEVTVTAIGRSVIDQANRVLEEVETIKHLAKNGQDPLKGVLKIGVIHTMMPQLLTNLTILLNERLPGLFLVIVENHASRLIDMLRQGEIDLVICSMPFSKPGFVEFTPLYDERLMLAVPAKHHWASRQSINVEELHSEKVLLTGNGCCLKDHVLQICSPIHRAFGPSLAMNKLTDNNSLNSLFCMVASGVGVSVVPELSGNDQDVVKKNIVALKPLIQNNEPAKRRLLLAWRKTFRRKEAAEYVIKAIQEIQSKHIAVDSDSMAS